MYFKKSATLFFGGIILFTLIAAIYYPNLKLCGGVIILDEDPAPMLTIIP